MTFKQFILQGDPEPAVLCQHVPPESPSGKGKGQLGTRHPASAETLNYLNGWRYWTATSFRIDEEPLAVSICNLEQAASMSKWAYKIM